MVVIYAFTQNEPNGLTGMIPFLDDESKGSAVIRAVKRFDPERLAKIEVPTGFTVKSISL